MTKTIFRKALTCIAAGIALTAASLSADAARLVARNFRVLPNNQAAINRDTEKRDQNGKQAALIIIHTPLDFEKTYFDNGVLGVVAREIRNGQIWLYIPARSQTIKIINQRFDELTYPFTEEIKEGRVYTMDILPEGREVTLSASVNGATVTVDGEDLGKSPLNAYLSFGEHPVKAESGSMLYEGNIMVTTDGPTRFGLPMEDQNLKYSEVTVRVPDNADIWFQGRNVGTGEWKDRLLGGQKYSVEIVKENCENNVVHFETVAGSPLTVDCPAPVPYRGYLSVHVVPTTGTKIIDGDTIVAQHNLQKQLKVGDYTYTFQKSGYVPVKRTFKVTRNTNTTDTVTLQRIQYIRSNAIYADLGFSYGSTYGVGVRVGGVYKNFNLELGYTLGLGKSNEVYWYDNPVAGENGSAEYPGMYNTKCTYSIDNFEAKLGYQFSFVERFGVTPQLGYLGQRLRGGDYGNGAMCHSLSIGARLMFKPLEWFGLFVNPEYAVPVSVNQLYKDINSAPGSNAASGYIGGDAGFAEGGFHVAAGLTFTF